MTGLHLAQYRIDAELGRGGMGIVYRAHDTKLDRTVALKVLPASALGSDEDRARFYREARAAAKLSHANICHVYQVDEAVPGDGPPGSEPRPFIAMEFVDGESLADRIARGPMKLDEAVRVARQVSGALEAAHRQGVVHRDVKPQNVMLSREGEAKVLDFGLALTAQTTKLTRLGTTVGTTAYMSPEQARAEDVDLRTDVWAVGATLYEMIAGRRPFAGDYDQAVVYAILNEDPQPLTALRTGVPMELERIVFKCLAKDRGSRYQHMDELRVDLENLDAVSTRQGAAPTARASVEQALPRRSRLRGWVLALALVAVAVLPATAVWLARPAAMETDRTIRRIPVHMDGIVDVRLPAMNPDRTVLCFNGRDPEAGFGIFCHDMTTGETARIADLDRWTTLSIGPDDRLAYSTPEGLFVRQLPQGLPVHVSDSLYAPFWIDRTTLGATTRARDRVAAVDLEDGSVRTLVGRGDLADSSRSVTATSVHPTEPLLLYWLEDPSLIQGDGTVYVLDLRTGTSRELVAGAVNARFAGGSYILYQYGNYGALEGRAFDPRTLNLVGEREPILDQVPWDKNGPYQPGDLLEVRRPEADGVVHEWTFDGTLQASWPLPSGFRGSVFSPDGSRVIGVQIRNWSDPGTAIVVYDLATGRTQTVDDSPGTTQSMSWTSSGTEVVYERISRTGPDRIVRTVIGSRSARDLPVTGRKPSLSPSGEWLAYVRQDDAASSTIVLREMATGRERLLEEVAGFSAVNGFSPDDRFLQYRVESERYVYSVEDSSRVSVPADTWIWGPEGRFLYGHRGDMVVRTPYSSGRGFEVGRTEDLFRAGPCPWGYTQACGVHVGTDRILTIGPGGGDEAPDHSVILWFQGFAAAKNPEG